MEAVKLAVLLVLFNDKEHIPRLISSLSNQTFSSFKVYAVDNSPDNSSAKLLKKIYPKAIILENNENLGYASGNNRLAKKAFSEGADVVFIANTDIELEKSCLESLLQYRNPNTKVMAIGPIIYYGYTNGRSDEIQSFIMNANFKTATVKPVPTNNSEFSEKKVNFLQGCAFLYEKKAYDKIGLFPDENFLYGEELDLAYRFSINSFEMLLTPRAKVWHYHDWGILNHSKHKTQYYYMLRNRVLFFKRYRKHTDLARFLIMQILYLPVKINWARRIADIKLAKYYYLGIYHGLVGKTGKTTIKFH
ncbi:MAG: glycosyltransferase family 2 protein [Candidatus Atribacteria bacterium]|nr:glycosyltransferase family 2 protein [Candidatus Atribacteria bacterium]